MLRVWYPGMEPLDNSHLRNMALFAKGNWRGREGTPEDMNALAKDALRRMSEDLLAGRVKG